MEVKMKNKIVEYIWLDGRKLFRSKIRVIKKEDTISNWNYDGSSTWQADGNKNTEIILKPYFICKNPFEEHCTDYFAFCETYDTNDNPTLSNTRKIATDIFKHKSSVADTTWYGIEQEYFIFYKKTNSVILDGFSQLSLVRQHSLLESLKSLSDSLPLDDISRNHYCIMEDGQIAMTHLNYCNNISGINAEVALGQWEYQIGPSAGINAADQLIASRFILERVANNYGCYIVWDPKPFEYLNGSGCHINFSTKEMREPCTENNGIFYIKEAISMLERKHQDHMLVYGINNNKRMTGKNETAPFNTFSWGVGTRNTSIRIGNDVMKTGYGYFEDRRPASNIDPYLATSIIFNTICLSNDLY